MPLFFPYLAIIVVIAVIIMAIIQYRKSQSEDFEKRDY